MDMDAWRLEAKMKCDTLEKRLQEPQEDMDDYVWHMMHILLRSYQKDYSVLLHMDKESEKDSALVIPKFE